MGATVYLIAAVFFALLTAAIAMIGATGKLALAVTNPVAALLALIGFGLAAAAFFVRHVRAQVAAGRYGGGPMTQNQNASAFWTWLSRIASVVGLLAGSLSFGRQLYELLIGPL